jgi:hypothetical protein
MRFLYRQDGDSSCLLIFHPRDRIHCLPWLMGFQYFEIEIYYRAVSWATFCPESVLATQLSGPVSIQAVSRAVFYPRTVPQFSFPGHYLFRQCLGSVPSWSCPAIQFPGPFSIQAVSGQCSILESSCNSVSRAILYSGSVLGNLLSRQCP